MPPSPPPERWRPGGRLPAGLLLGLDGGLDGEGGQLAHHGRGAPETALAQAAAGGGEVPVDLGEQTAWGDEAVRAQLGVVGQVQLEVHDRSPSELTRNRQRSWSSGWNGWEQRLQRMGAAARVVLATRMRRPQLQVAAS